MRFAVICSAMLSAASLSSVALAQAAAPVIKNGMTVTTSDGKRIGRVYDVDKARDGSLSVAIIRDAKIIRIAVSTLTAADKGLVTSLTSEQLSKLR